MLAGVGDGLAGLLEEAGGLLGGGLDQRDGLGQLIAALLAEQEASEKLTAAAKDISAHPAALELRRMQMISEVGVEHNTTTIILMPSDFVTMARKIGDLVPAESSNTATGENP